MSSDPDLALVRQSASGDARAAERLVRKRGPSLVALARRMLGDAAEAEDVAQEVFLRAWRDAERWRDEGRPFFAWMCRVATNLCLDRLRKRRETRFDPETHDRPAEGPSPAAALASLDRASAVEAALMRLPERQRAAITLVHFQELSNIEAAAILEVSVDALESLLARGRRALKAALLPNAADLIGEMES